MYEAEISRRNPTAFLLLVDQSGSMAEPFGMDTSKSKAAFVADVVNRWLQGLVLRCAKGEEIRDYFDVGVIAFGGDVRWALSTGHGDGLMPISAIGAAPLRIEDRLQKIDDGAGGLVERKVKFPVWVEAVSAGNTPMCRALAMARAVIEPWVASHQSSFPPTILIITDGEFTDGDPSSLAAALRSLRTDDGNVLLFNCHISGLGGRPILYPDSAEGLPDAFARLLFNMSSELPDVIMDAARDYGYSLRPGARGYAYQADSARFVEFLEIGTRTSRTLVPEA